MAKCKSCGATMDFATTKNGKQIPLDAKPHVEGNITREIAPDGRLEAFVLNGEHLAEARRNGLSLYRSHFVTCSTAAQHRKTRA